LLQQLKPEERNLLLICKLLNKKIKLEFGDLNPIGVDLIINKAAEILVKETPNESEEKFKNMKKEYKH